MLGGELDRGFFRRGLHAPQQIVALMQPSPDRPAARPDAPASSWRATAARSRISVSMSGADRSAVALADRQRRMRAVGRRASVLIDMHGTLRLTSSPHHVTATWCFNSISLPVRDDSIAAAQTSRLARPQRPVCVTGLPAMASANSAITRSRGLLSFGSAISSRPLLRIDQQPVRRLADVAALAAHQRQAEMRLMRRARRDGVAGALALGGQLLLGRERARQGCGAARGRASSPHSPTPPISSAPEKCP